MKEGLIWLGITALWCCVAIAGISLMSGQMRPTSKDPAQFIETVEPSKCHSGEATTVCGPIENGWTGHTYRLFLTFPREALLGKQLWTEVRFHDKISFSSEGPEVKCAKRNWFVSLFTKKSRAKDTCKAVFPVLLVDRTAPGFAPEFSLRFNLSKLTALAFQMGYPPGTQIYDQKRQLRHRYE